MGDYNRDSDPNIPAMANIAHVKFSTGNLALKSDQWTINSASRVISLNDGTNRVRCKVKFNPKIIMP